MNDFLKNVRANFLKSWMEDDDFKETFSNDADAATLYVTLLSIVEKCKMTERARNTAFAELKEFAESASISERKQRVLERKVRNSDWDARKTIQEIGIEAFIDDFVAVCLKDKKIQPWEYKLIYLICSYLNLSKSQVSKLLRTRLSMIRYRAIIFFDHPLVSTLITVLIILNAIQLGLMTCSWFAPYKGKWFYRLDFAFICLFTIEMFCRIFAFRKDFFRESQNIFDVIVVALSWIPSPIFRWASALRIFRAMLLLNRLDQLKTIMKSFVEALPNIGWVSVLFFIIYYVFAVLTTNLFGHDFIAFSSIENSLFSLFQLMTLESWPELLAPILDKYPYSWLVFIPFMVLTSYVFLQLITGIIVTALKDVSLKKKSDSDEIRDMSEQIAMLTRKIENLQKTLDKGGK